MAKKTGEDTTQKSRAAWRVKIGDFVLDMRVQNFVLAVIVLNAITLGLETSAEIHHAIGTQLAILDTIALTVFVIEIVLKLLAFDFRFFRDGWNVFDFLVVVLSLIPGAGAFSVLRALRVLRVLRLINRLPQLRRIASSIIKALPGIGAIAGLMAIIFYVGAVMATTLFSEKFPEWFGSVPASLYSLFQIMTLESWSMGIVRPVMAEYPDAWMFFVPFILVSAFVMLNLFVAVIVDTMSNLQDEDKSDTKAESVSEIAVLSAQLQEVQKQLADLKTLIENSAKK